MAHNEGMLTRFANGEVVRPRLLLTQNIERGRLNGRN